MVDNPALILVALLAVAVLYVWTALALQFVLRKAGEPGWQAWVPILNTIVLLRLGGFSGWWVLLGILPVVNIALLVVLIISLHRITVAFDYGAGMTVLAVLVFPVWLSILAWGTAEWLGHDDPPAEQVVLRHRDDDLQARLSGPLVTLPFPFGTADAAPEPAAAAPLPPAPVAAAPVGPPPVAPAPVAAPVSGIPPRDDTPRPPVIDAWAPPVPTRSPLVDTDDVTDSSAEISAVADAPRLGEPRAAAGAVSALWRVPGDAPAVDDAVEETVVAPRRRILWHLIPPAGDPVSITADVVIVGRRPSADPDYPGAQLVSVVDDTRTMSKTHARLERFDAVWTITDLGSTNGVFLLSEAGVETEVVVGTPQPLGERFLLGDAPLRFALASGGV